MLDVEKFVDGLHEYLERAFQPLAKRLEAVEKRQPEKGDKGSDGANATVEMVQEAVGKELPAIVARMNDMQLNMVEEFFKTFPVPKDGKDGETGQKGDPGGRGERGEKGDPGRDGKDFDPELVRIEVARVLPDMVERAQAFLSERMDAAFKALPPPKDGERGPQGEPGIGEKGRDGTDGKSVTLADLQPVMEAMEARIALGIERRAAEIAEKAVARIPVPKDGKDGVSGKDGADGLGFDDFDIEYDDERTFRFKWERDGQVKTRIFKAPIVLYRGVYKPSGAYEKGDSVTYGGSTWVARKDAPGTPGEGDSGWQLAVKRGAK
jgi:hypothetical protein